MISICFISIVVHIQEEKQSNLYFYTSTDIQCLTDIYIYIVINSFFCQQCWGELSERKSGNYCAIQS